MTPGGRAVVAVVGGLAVTLAACAHEAAPAPSPRPPAAARNEACPHAVPSCSGAPPSYARDVRPILAQRCFKCHAGSGVAADEHDFSHVETLRAERRALKAEIQRCAMPPASEPRVPDAEADVLLRWAVCGGAD